MTDQLYILGLNNQSAEMISCRIPEWRSTELLNELHDLNRFNKDFNLEISRIGEMDGNARFVVYSKFSPASVWLIPAFIHMWKFKYG